MLLAACWDNAEPERAPSAAPATTLLAPVARDAACERDQARVASEFVDSCVDLYELPGFGQAPDVLSLDQARDACERRGRRLCREAEWEAACRGPDGLEYPYGPLYVPGQCAVGRAAPVGAGTLNACRATSGVFDLSGNAAEWVDNGLLKGGDIASDAFGARCGTRARVGTPPEPAVTGARCCSDPR
ncbi:MAG: SUMF1/EgtB/PvdO family nonheme iron enzyme [Myxococcales bacterium]|nr:SUMF1/EgtB/PvdO family nonheme iron enzyme [Myxococcales bacterium]